MARKFPKDQFDRMPQMEANLGIALSAVGATVAENDGEVTVEIVGEITALDGLNVDVEIIGVVYDDEADAVARESARIYADEFTGFDTFWLYFSGLDRSPARIRIYPKVA